MSNISHLNLRLIDVRVPVIIFALSVLTLHGPNANAQNAPVIITPAEQAVEQGIGTPLEIRIRSSKPLPPKSVLVMRGVPSLMKLSEGRLFGPGVWVVPVNSLEQLKVQVLQGFSSATLDLTLATLSGESLANASLTLTARPDRPQNAGDTVAAILPPQISPTERQAALALVERGHGFLRTGNVVVARQFYQRADASGLPEAAMALAATYDGNELARMKYVVGVTPDRGLAKKWYERAWQLGASEAEIRLGRLE